MERRSFTHSHLCPLTKQGVSHDAHYLGERYKIAGGLQVELWCTGFGADAHTIVIEKRGCPEMLPTWRYRRGEPD